MLIKADTYNRIIVMSPNYRCDLSRCDWKLLAGKNCRIFSWYRFITFICRYVVESVNVTFTFIIIRLSLQQKYITRASANEDLVDYSFFMVLIIFNQNYRLDILLGQYKLFTLFTFRLVLILNGFLSDYRSFIIFTRRLTA